MSSMYYRSKRQYIYIYSKLANCFFGSAPGRANSSIFSKNLSKIREKTFLKITIRTGWFFKAGCLFSRLLHWKSGMTRPNSGKLANLIYRDISSRTFHTHYMKKTKLKWERERERGEDEWNGQWIKWEYVCENTHIQILYCVLKMT